MCMVTTEKYKTIISLKKYLLYVAFSLFICKMFIGHIICSEQMTSYFSIAQNIFIVLSGIFLGCIVFADFIFDKKSFIKEIIVISFFVLIGYIFTDIELSVMVAFILLAHDADFDKIVKSYFYTILSCLIILSILLIFGVATYYVQPATSDEHMRRILGMNSNLLGGFITSTVLAGWYLYIKDRIILTFFISWLVASFIGFFLVSRTGAVVLFAFPLICLTVYLLRESFFDKKISKYLFISLPIINTVVCIVLSFLSPLFLGHEYDSLRTFLNRFYVPYKLVSENGVSLLGGTLLHDDYYVLNMDCAYLRPFVYNGIITGLFVMFGIFLLFKKIYETKRKELIIVAIAFLLQGFMETYMIKVHFNWLLLFLYADMYRKDQNDVNIKYIE